MTVERLLAGESVVGQSERQLLDRFVSDRDEVAFEAIVARHGPMVLGVCRSILDHSTDVEDAFQATFLVLVRKAGSLRDRDQLSPLAPRRRPTGGAPRPGSRGEEKGERDRSARLHRQRTRPTRSER